MLCLEKWISSPAGLRHLRLMAAVSGSQLRPAAPLSLLSLAETLLRLIQGEIMGPVTPNPLQSLDNNTAASWQGGPVELRVGPD